MKTQKDKVLSHLKRRDLRGMGFQISSKLETKRKKTYARYTLA